MIAMIANIAMIDGVPIIGSAARFGEPPRGLPIAAILAIVAIVAIDAEL